MKDYQYAFALFKVADGQEDRDICGINAIQEFIKAKEEIPEELYPFIYEACDAWRRTTGTANRIRKKTTKDNWHKLIAEVRYVYHSHKDMEVSDAIEHVANKHGLNNAETLNDYYHKPKHRKDRAAGDMYYDMSQWGKIKNK